MLPCPPAQGGNTSLQKKAFKAISTICCSEDLAQQQFVASVATDLKGVIEASVHTSVAATKYHRLVIIGRLVAYLDNASVTDFIPKVITEVIISTKEVNERARMAAFECLVAVGKSIKTRPPGAITMQQYVDCVVAGLAAQSPHMRSATILALSRLVYQFSEDVSEAQIDQMIGSVHLLLQSRSREVIKSALSFIKVAITVLSPDDFAKYLEETVSILVTEASPILRVKTKMILERMVRKFGYDTVLGYCPDEDKKLIVNIKKTREREKRKARAEKNDDDGDAMDGGVSAPRPTRSGVKPSYDELLCDSDGGSDADNEMEATDTKSRSKAQSKTARKARGSTFIKDDGEEDALDLLDPRSTSKIRTSLPKQKRTLEHSFPKSEDGRLFIEDEEEIAAQREAQGGMCVC